MGTKGLECVVKRLGEEARTYIGFTLATLIFTGIFFVGSSFTLNVVGGYWDNRITEKYTEYRTESEAIHRKVHDEGAEILDLMTKLLYRVAEERRAITTSITQYVATNKEIRRELAAQKIRIQALEQRLTELECKGEK